MLRKVGCAATLAFAGACSVAGANVTAVHRIFYLKLSVGECAQAPKGTGGPGHKTLLVVPCSSPVHNLETYAVLHGGWGHGTPPSHPAVDALGRSLCLNSFQRRFGHPIRRGYGYQYYFPDPGAETARYGDRFICSLGLYPSFGPMGAGTHFR